MKFKLQIKNTEKLKGSVRDWYMEEFPEDELGEKLPKRLTFRRVVTALNRGENVYDLMGKAADSIIRERMFGVLSYFLDCEYDDIYKVWLYGRR